jgi:hypothetical protein
MTVPTSLDRLIRVREVRARLALAALGWVETRRQAESDLDGRVQALLAGSGSSPGRVDGNAANARAAADAMLGRLADDVALRLAVTSAEQRRLAQALARARAAVDAAVTLLPLRPGTVLPIDPRRAMARVLGNDAIGDVTLTPTPDGWQQVEIITIGLSALEGQA